MGRKRSISERTFRHLKQLQSKVKPTLSEIVNKADSRVVVTYKPGKVIYSFRGRAAQELCEECLTRLR